MISVWTSLQTNKNKLLKAMNWKQIDTKVTDKQKLGKEWEKKKNPESSTRRIWEQKWNVWIQMNRSNTGWLEDMSLELMSGSVIGLPVCKKCNMPNCKLTCKMTWNC